MLRPKKNSYKEFDKEKNSSDSKIPHPPPTPIILLMVYTLGQTIQPILYKTHHFSPGLPRVLPLEQAYDMYITLIIQRTTFFLTFAHLF